MLVACAHLSLVTTLEEQQPLSLARSLAENRQTERAKDTQQTDKRGSGEAEVEVFFFITNVRCAAELLLSSGKRSKRRSKEEEEEYLLAGLSVSCFPDVQGKQPACLLKLRHERGPMKGRNFWQCWIKHMGVAVAFGW